MDNTVPALTIQHCISHTMHTSLINFNYWSVSKTAETNASRPRPQLPRPRPQNFSLETKTMVSRTTRLLKV